MSAERDMTRIVRSWLQVDEHESADRVLDIVLDLLDTTPQHRSWRPVRRIAVMNTYAKFAIAAAAVLVVAVLGYNLLPSSGGVGGQVATPTPSPTIVPSPSLAQGSAGWSGQFKHQRYNLMTSFGVPISFMPPSEIWYAKGQDFVETGQFPTPSYAWIAFVDDIGNVATDPCHGKAAPVKGNSIDDLTMALATLPGMTAQEPVDTTVGGRPAKVVALTVDPDPACPMDQFWLYGQTSLYPNSVDSTLRLWITTNAGHRFVIHTDQAGDNPQLEQEIQKIIDSFQFL